MRKSLYVLAALATVVCTQLSPPASLGQSGSAPASAGEAEETLKGKVLERIDAAPYSYLRLSTASGEVWAAVPQTAAATGTEVIVTGAFPMKEFESKTLKRKFDLVYFGTLADSGAAAAPMAAHGGSGAMPPGHPPLPNGDEMAAQHRAAGAGPSDNAEIKVDRASGPDARTIAEIHAQRSALSDKPVTVHGKVVKYNGGIMGRNWLHLRDGSGSQDKGDNDITVTTQDEAAVGDVVTAKGTVRLDKDFGAGYAYPVIVEEAHVAK